MHRIVAMIMFAIGWANLFAFHFLSKIRGGYPFGGHSEDGHYFLAGINEYGRDTGQLVEVSKATFDASTTHWISVGVTMPVGMLAIALVVAEDVWRRRKRPPPKP